MKVGDLVRQSGHGLERTGIIISSSPLLGLSRQIVQGLMEQAFSNSSYLDRSSMGNKSGVGQ